MFKNYSPAGILLPSGTIIPPREGADSLPSGFDVKEWREAMRFAPGGLASAEPSQIATPATVASYEVLPSRLGLAQLVGAEKVQRLTRGRYLIIASTIISVIS